MLFAGLCSVRPVVQLERLGTQCRPFIERPEGNDKSFQPAGIKAVRQHLHPTRFGPIILRHTEQRGRSDSAHGRVQPAHLRQAEARAGAFEHKDAPCIRDIAQQFAPQKAQRCTAVVQQLSDAVLVPPFDDGGVQSQIRSWTR